jgi:DeoR/GlpR family transcriptional regulator of sugar metabolism
MRAVQRQQIIQEIINSKDFIDLESLSQKVMASDSTVRRDLMELERRGLLKRVHGGAVAAAGQEEVPDYRWRSTRHCEEKALIGKAAARLIEEGQTVILDGGSTVLEVARQLLGRSLQVITNSLPIAQIFGDSKNVDTILTGGLFYPRLGVMLGPFCEQILDSVSADLLVMGMGGISARGLSNSNALVVGSERKMIEVSQKVMIVADHSKFGRDAMVHLEPLETADWIVTDSQLSSEHQELLRQHHVELILA